MIVYFWSGPGFTVNCLNKSNQQKKILRFSTFRSSLRYPYQAHVSSVLTNGIAASVNEIWVIDKYPGHVVWHVIVWFLFSEMRCKNVLEFLGSSNVQYKLLSFLQVIIART